LSEYFFFTQSIITFSGDCSVHSAVVLLVNSGSYFRKKNFTGNERVNVKHADEN